MNQKCGFSKRTGCLLILRTGKEKVIYDGQEGKGRAGQL